MSVGRRVLPTISLVLMLWLTTCIVAGPDAQVQGTGTTDGGATSFPEVPESMAFELGSGVIPISTGHLPFPANATVIAATVTVIPEAGAPAGLAGQPGGLVNPEEPQVDVWADGTPEWAFAGKGYGQAGRQTLFSDGTGEVSLAPQGRGPQGWPNSLGVPGSATILLPRDAAVDTARLLIGPVFPDGWWDAAWKRRLPMTITPLGDGPVQPFLFQRELYLGPFHGQLPSDLRLTRVADGVEEEHPFWAVPTTSSKAIVGFMAGGDGEGDDGPWTYNLYFDGPEGATTTVMERSVAPIVTMSSEDEKPQMPSRLPDGHLSIDGPHGITALSDGSVIVTDTAHHRVIVLDETGDVTLTIGVYGEAGADSRHLNCPHDAISGTEGGYMVADTCNHRVQVFDPQGNLQQTVGRTGSPGMGQDQFLYPWSVAIDDLGNLHVADLGNDRIQIFNNLSWHSAWWTIGVTGEGGGDSAHLRAPKGMAVGDDILVADSFNGRVQVFDDKEDRWADVSLGLNHLIGPSDVALAPDEIYVADSQANRISILGADGHLVRDITGLGFPRGVSVGPGGALWISDTGNDRLVLVVNASIDIGAIEELPSPRDLSVLMGDEVLLRVPGPMTSAFVLDDISGAVSSALKEAHCSPDAFGNEMCAVGIRVEAVAGWGGAYITMNGLDIRYDYSFRMSLALTAGTDFSGRTTELPVKVSSRNGGRLVLADIELVVDHPPFVTFKEVTTLPIPEEGTNLPVIDLGEVFLDEGPLSYYADLPGHEDVVVGVGPGGWLEVDLSSAHNLSGRLNIGVTATDPLGQTAGPVTIIIPVLDIPDPPALHVPGPQAATCTVPLSISLAAEDGDGDALSYLLIDGPAGATVTGDGEVLWSPSATAVGENIIIVSVSDGTYHTPVDIAIDVTCDGSPPVIATEDRVSATAGERLSIPVRVDDPDGDIPTVKLVDPPRGMSYDASTSTILWVPDLDQEGHHTVDITASDGVHEASALLRIEVARPGPWIQLTDGAEHAKDGRIAFRGLAGGVAEELKRVEAKVDCGDWRPAEGTSFWRFQVDTDGMVPGTHKVEFRAYDGQYSETTSIHFIVQTRKAAADHGDDAVAGWEWPLAMFIVIIGLIGGIVVLKRINGILCCVHSSPEGPTMCIPLGDGRETVGGNGDGGGQEDDVERPRPVDVPRNIRCTICLGRIKRPEDYMECPRCGRLYHRACAKRVGSCPMCGETLVGDES